MYDCSKFLSCYRSMCWDLFLLHVPQKRKYGCNVFFSQWSYCVINLLLICLFVICNTIKHILLACLEIVFFVLVIVNQQIWWQTKFFLSNFNPLIAYMRTCRCSCRGFCCIASVRMHTLSYPLSVFVISCVSTLKQNTPKLDIFGSNQVVET